MIPAAVAGAHLALAEAFRAAPAAVFDAAPAADHNHVNLPAALPDGMYSNALFNK